jgi:hypothetical protein
MTEATEQLRRLVRTSRGKGRLDPAAAREAIAVAVSEALPTADAPGGGAGFVWPLTETSRTTETVRVYDPADATRYVDIERALTITFEDEVGQTGTLVLNP